MAEPTQFMFTHKELVTAMIKHQGLHTGRWRLTIQFGFGASNMGPAEGEMSPTAIAAVTAVGLQAAESTDASNLCVDAAIANPSSSAAAPVKKSRRRGATAK